MSEQAERVGDISSGFGNPDAPARVSDEAAERLLSADRDRATEQRLDVTPPQPNAGDDDALEDGTGTALETASDAVGPYAGETLTEGQSRGTSGDASGGGTASGW